ncbi:MAG: hypothetical protein ACI97A_000339 [Planctomycetota bacterium]|jgi:hypothetical protein
MSLYKLSVTKRQGGTECLALGHYLILALNNEETSFFLEYGRSDKLGVLQVTAVQYVRSMISEYAHMQPVGILPAYVLIDIIKQIYHCIQTIEHDSWTLKS